MQMSIHTSVHPELIPGTHVECSVVEDCLFNPKLKWATVVLSNGVTRDILVEEIVL